MSEGKQYIPDQFAGREFKTASVTQAKASTKLYKTSSSDPAKTDDTGLGYAVGTIWTNTTSGQIFIATDVSAEEAVWKGQEGDNINEFLYQASSVVGKSGGHSTTSPAYQAVDIESVPVASDGNMTDIGEMSPSLGHKGHQKGCAKDGYPASNVYWYGVQGSHPSDAHISEMTRHAVSSPATLVDIGEENNAHSSGTQGQSKTNWFTWGGGGFAPAADGLGGSPSSGVTQIEKSTFASPTTTSDSGGDLTVTVESQYGFTDLDGAKCWMAGGQTPVNAPPRSRLETIESFPTAISSGNQTDEGELSAAKYKGSGCNSTTNWYYHGQEPSTNNIYKGNFASPETDSDIGELTETVYRTGASSGDTNGYRYGGYNPSDVTLDTVDKFSFTSDGNASNVGEMTEPGGYVGGWQD